jgi:RNA polymerase sigma factor (sigma-70 family)
MSTRKSFVSPSEQAVALDAYEALAMRAARRLSRSLHFGAPDREDARQQALVGLVIAARTFDPKAGITFRQHALQQIRTELKRFLDTHRRGGFTRVGPQPPVVVSTNGLPIEDRLAAVEDTAQARCDALAALALLKDRERRILSARFLDGRTLNNTAQALHLTAERVRQIQVSAIQTIRRKLHGLAS